MRAIERSVLRPATSLRRSSTSLPHSEASASKADDVCAFHMRDPAELFMLERRSAAPGRMEHDKLWVCRRRRRPFRAVRREDEAARTIRRTGSQRTRVGHGIHRSGVFAISKSGNVWATEHHARCLSSFARRSRSPGTAHADDITFDGPVSDGSFEHT